MTLSEPNAYVTEGKRLLLALASPKNLGFFVAVKSLLRSQERHNETACAESISSILLMIARPE